MDTQIGECLARLAPFLDLSRVAITGSVALDLQVDASLRRSRQASEPRQDLDLIADAPDVVSPRVLEEFLVSHYHLPHAGYPKFLVQLADPVTRVRVDVLPDSLGLLSDSSPCAVDRLAVRVMAPRAVLEHKLAMLRAASAEHRVDAKHYHDVVSLVSYSDRPLPPVSASVLEETDYSRDPDARCKRCDASRHLDFPLADKEQILAVLGYV